MTLFYFSNCCYCIFGSQEKEEKEKEGEEEARNERTDIMAQLHEMLLDLDSLSLNLSLSLS